MIERIIGNTMAGLLILILILGVCFSVYSFVVHAGHGMSAYGARGDGYMSE